MLMLVLLLVCGNVTGLIHVISKEGRGVTLTPSDELIQAPGAAVSATTFLVTNCRARDTISEDLRPRCVSLMDASDVYKEMSHKIKDLSVEDQEHRPGHGC